MMPRQGVLAATCRITVLVATALCVHSVAGAAATVSRTASLRPYVYSEPPVQPVPSAAQVAVDAFQRSFAANARASQAVVAITALAALAAGFVHPTAATKLPTALTILATTQCGFSDSCMAVPWWLSLSPTTSSSSGGVPLTLVFASALLLVAQLTNLLLHHVAQERIALRKRVGSAALALTCFLSPTVASMSTTALLHLSSAQGGGGTWTVVAALYALGEVTCIVALLAVYLARGVGLIPHVPGKAMNRIAEASPLFAYQNAISQTRNVNVMPCRLLVIEDLAISCLVAVVGGLRPGAPSCTLIAVTQFGLVAAHGFFVFLYSPLRKRVDAVSHAVLSGFLVLISLCAIIVTANDTSKPVLGYLVAALIVAQIVTMLVCVAQATRRALVVSEVTLEQARLRRSRNIELGLPLRFVPTGKAAAPMTASPLLLDLGVQREAANPLDRVGGMPRLGTRLVTEVRVAAIPADPLAISSDDSSGSVTPRSSTPVPTGHFNEDTMRVLSQLSPTLRRELLDGAGVVDTSACPVAWQRSFVPAAPHHDRPAQRSPRRPRSPSLERRQREGRGS
jgi:hypothetical protein